MEFKPDGDNISALEGCNTSPYASVSSVSETCSICALAGGSLSVLWHVIYFNFLDHKHS